LANACGTGKTITVLLYLALRKRRILREVENGKRTAENVKPILVIVPNTVVQEWIKDWQKSTKEDLDVCVYHGSGRGKYKLPTHSKAIDDWYNMESGVMNAGRVLLTTY